MHDIFERLPESVGRTSGLLAGCDPRVRLIVTLAAILAVVTSTRIGFGLTALGGSLVALAWGRARFAQMLHRLAGPALLAAGILLAKTFLTGITPLAELDLGIGRLTATREGLSEGALIATRILGSLSLLTLLCSNASMGELAAALRWARVPRAWLEIALLMHRYLHVFASQAAGVVCAQRVRLGYRSPRRLLASVGIAAGMIVLRSLDQAQRSHQGMIARAYRGAIPLPELPPLSRSQAAVACMGVAAVAAALAIAERFCP